MIKVRVLIILLFINAFNIALFAANRLEEAVYQEISYKNFPTQTYKIEKALISSRSIFLIEHQITNEIAITYMKEMLYLDWIKPGEPIHLFISSNGGLGSIMLSNFIMKLRSPVDTYALGSCWSGATMLLAAGTGRRYAFKNSRIGIHVPLGSLNLDKENQEWACEKVNQRMYEDFWKSVARLPKEYYPFKGEVKICFTLEEALEYGIIDEIIDEHR